MLSHLKAHLIWRFRYLLLDVEFVLLSRKEANWIKDTSIPTLSSFLVITNYLIQYSIESVWSFFNAAFKVLISFKDSILLQLNYSLNVILVTCIITNAFFLYITWKESHPLSFSSSAVILTKISILSYTLWLNWFALHSERNHYHKGAIFSKNSW